MHNQASYDKETDRDRQTETESDRDRQHDDIIIVVEYGSLLPSCKLHSGSSSQNAEQGNATAVQLCLRMTTISNYIDIQ